MMRLLCFGLSVLWLTACQKSSQNQTPAEWPVYGGNAASQRYSPASQITPDNVKDLQVAWTFKTGDLDTANRGQMQCNPIVVNGTAYFTSAKVRVFAVDAATGQEQWRFDPFAWLGGQNSWAGTSRGLSYWAEGDEQRILVSAGNYLIALDARTGKPIASFGDKGKVDLQRDLDHHKEKFLIVSNTPGIVYKDLIIMGMRLSEGLDAPPGHVRAYDVRTGKRRWIFHTIPQPGEFGHNTWEDSTAWRRIGGANNWAGMSLDEARGLVFVPTGSATYDFYGGFRKGANLFANCIVALDASTGKRVWHYQTVHHDLWDTDLPAPPTLVTVKKDGKTIDALAQITKHGFVFVLDRATGEPVFPIDEKPVPASDLPGEQAWPTQPMPRLPVPFMRQTFNEQDIIDISPEHRAEILPQFRALRSGGMFIPPSLQGAVHFPGFDGGGEWGGAAYDPARNWLYVNANEVPWILQMEPTLANKGDALHAKGALVYAGRCANCHGSDRKGNGAAFPSLLDLNKKYDAVKLSAFLRAGKGAMPSFAYLPPNDLANLVNFLLDIKTEAVADQKEVAGEAELVTPYTMKGYKRFVTRDGYPAIKPPWGTLNAIDLNTGQLVWKSPLGEIEALSKLGLPPTGTENYGGPAITAGGVLFIAASKDEKFRAFDMRTGKVLWETQLPAAGYATPAIYEAKGKQFVLIACGGGKLGTKSGDSYIAFALPRK